MAETTNEMIKELDALIEQELRRHIFVRNQALLFICALIVLLPLLIIL